MKVKGASFDGAAVIKVEGKLCLVDRSASTGSRLQLLHGARGLVCSFFPCLAGGGGGEGGVQVSSSTWLHYLSCCSAKQQQSSALSMRPDRTAFGTLTLYVLVPVDPRVDHGREPNIPLLWRHWEACQRSMDYLFQISLGLVVQSGFPRVSVGILDIYWVRWEFVPVITGTLYKLIGEQQILVAVQA